MMDHYSFIDSLFYYSGTKKSGHRNINTGTTPQLNCSLKFTLQWPIIFIRCIEGNVVRLVDW